MPETPSWLVPKEVPATKASADESRLPDLIDFAKRNKLTVGSTTGGSHNTGSRHYSGNAMDIKGSGAFDDATVQRLSDAAKAEGFLLRDERRRPPRQRVWGGPHIHIESPRTSQQPSWLVPQSDTSAQSQTPDQPWLVPKQEAAPIVPASQPDIVQSLTRTSRDIDRQMKRRIQQAQRDQPSLADLKRYDEKVVAEMYREQGVSTNLPETNVDLRVLKGEQPSNPMVYARAQELIGRVAPRRTEEPQKTQAEREVLERDPAFVAARKRIGRLPGTNPMSPGTGIVSPRGVVSALQRFGGETVKAIGGAFELPELVLGKLAESIGLPAPKVKEYLNQRGQVLSESASLPLNAQGQEIERQLPEKATEAVTGLGMSLAQLVLLKRATGLNLGPLMAIETTLKTSNEKPETRAAKAVEAYTMGRVLDQHLSRPLSAVSFAAPTGVQSAIDYSQGNITLEDALLNTSVEATAGAILGGKQKGLRDAGNQLRSDQPQPVSRAADGQLPRTQEPVRTARDLPRPVVADTEGVNPDMAWSSRIPQRPVAKRAEDQAAIFRGNEAAARTEGEGLNARQITPQPRPGTTTEAYPTQGGPSAEAWQAQTANSAVPQVSRWEPGRDIAGRRVQESQPTESRTQEGAIRPEGLRHVDLQPRRSRNTESGKAGQFKKEGTRAQAESRRQQVTPPEPTTEPQTSSVEVAQPAKAETATIPPASVPFMITRKMRADLSGRGYSEVAIDKLTPQEATAILSLPKPSEQSASKPSVETPASSKQPWEMRQSAWLERINPANQRIEPRARPIVYAEDMEGMFEGGNIVKRVPLKDGRMLVVRETKDGEVYGEVNGKTVGYATPLAEAELDITVDPAYQKQGVGSQLQQEFYRRNPDFQSGGVTDAGERSSKATHKLFVKEALSKGKPVPPEVLADYPDLAPVSTPTAVQPASEDVLHPHRHDRIGDAIMNNAFNSKQRVLEELGKGAKAIPFTENTGWGISWRTANGDIVRIFESRRSGKPATFGTDFTGLVMEREPAAKPPSRTAQSETTRVRRAVETPEDRGKSIAGITDRFRRDLDDVSSEDMAALDIAGLSPARRVPVQPETVKGEGDLPVKSEFQGLYHGSESATLTSFDLSKARESGYSGLGVWLTDSPTAAKEYGKHQLHVNAHIKNPVRFRSWNDFEEALLAYGSSAELKEWAKSRGHDGIVIKGEIDGHNQKIVVVFDPKQAEITTSQPSGVKPTERVAGTPLRELPAETKPSAEPSPVKVLPTKPGSANPASESVTRETLPTKLAPTKPITAKVSQGEALPRGTAAAKAVVAEARAERSLPKTLEAANLPGGAERFYDVATNEASTQRARQIIKEKGVDSAADWARSREKPSAEQSATAIELIRGLAKEAETAKPDVKAAKLAQAGDIASDMAVRATEAGQFNQYFATLAKESPEGVVYYAEKAIKRQHPDASLTSKQREAAFDSATRLKKTEVELETTRTQLADVEKQLAESLKRPVRQSETTKRIREWADQAEKDARARLAARVGVGKSGETGASTIPVDIADYAIIGAAKIARGSANFADWSKAMLQEFGEDIRPRLRQIHNESIKLFNDQSKLSKSYKAVDEINRLGGDPKIVEAAKKFVKGTSRTQFQREALREGLTPKAANDLAAQAYKLYSEAQSNLRQASRERVASKAEPDASPRRRAELITQRDQLMRQRGRERRELQSMLKHFEEGQPGIGQRLNNQFRGIVVSAMQTASRNLSSQGLRTSVESLTDAFELALVKGKSRLGWKIKEGDIDPRTRMLDTLKSSAYLLQRNKRIVNGILDEFPVEYEKMFRRFSSDVELGQEGKATKGIHKALDYTDKAIEIANMPNRFQEFLGRRAVFRGVLEARLRAKGIDLNETVRQGRQGEISRDDVNAAVDAALRVTFAESPKFGSKGDAFVRLTSSVPAPINPLTFSRFLWNGAKFSLEYQPTTALRGAYRTLKGQPGASRDYAKAAVGTAMLATGIGLYDALHNDDNEWYVLSVPKVGDVDIRPYQPFASYVFAAHFLRTRQKGEPITYESNSIKPYMEGLTGLSARPVPIVETGKALVDEDREWATVLKSMKRMGGESVAALLTPLKTPKQILSAFDAEEAKQRDTRDRPFTGPIMATVPFAGRNLPVRTGPRGEEVSQPKPLLQPLGIRVISPATQSTRAEKLARKYVRGKFSEEDKRTETEIERGVALSKLRGKSRQGIDVSKELETITATSRQKRSVRDAANQTQLYEDVKRLSPQESVLVYSVASPKQRDEIRATVERKVTTSKLNQLDDSIRAEIRSRMKKTDLRERKPGEVVAQP